MIFPLIFGFFISIVTLYIANISKDTTNFIIAVMLTWVICAYVCTMYQFQEVRKEINTIQISIKK